LESLATANEPRRTGVYRVDEGSRGRPVLPAPEAGARERTLRREAAADGSAGPARAAVRPPAARAATRSGPLLQAMDERTQPRLRLHADDQQRAVRIAAGDRAAFSQLVREHYPAAYGLAYRLLGDRLDAEEVAQDAFLKIHGAIGSFRGEASLRTWIMRIVLRLSLNRRRDRSRSAWYRLGLHASEPSSDVASPAAASPAAASPEGQLLSRETRARIVALIGELPDDLRQVLLLNSMEELSYAEISAILSIPVGTVASRLHAARRRLATSLAGHGLL